MNRLRNAIIPIIISIVILNACELFQASPLVNTIKERPKAPVLRTESLITRDSVGADWVKIHFSPVADAVDYRVYFTGGSSSDWKQYSDLDIKRSNNANLIEYNVTNLKSNSSYSFCVTAVDGANQESNKSAAITVHTKLQTPVISRDANPINHHTVSFTWDPGTEADASYSYAIFYSENPNIKSAVKIEPGPYGNYKHDVPYDIKFIGAINETNFTINTFEKSNTFYNIWVQAYTGKWGAVTNFSDFSAVKLQRTQISPPALFKVDENLTTASSIALSWESVRGASYYEIRYHKYPESESLDETNWAEKKTEDTRTVIAGLESNTLYVFTIRAHNNSDNYSIYTVRTPSHSTHVEAPDGISGITTSNSIHLSWADKNALKYNLRYRTSQSITSPSVPLFPDSNSQQLNSLRENTQYFFSISAKDLSGGESDKTDFYFFTLLSKPVNPVAAAISPNRINFSWDLKNGATGYIVEAYNSPYSNTSIPFIKTQISDITHYTIEGLSPDTQYHFITKAINSEAVNFNETSPREGEPSDIATATTLLPTPQKLSVAAYSTAIDISWQQVAGADSYKIFYNTSDSFETSAQYNPGYLITGNNYSIQGMESDTTYYLWVQALKNNGNYSPPSQAVYVRTIASSITIIFDFTNPSDPVLQGMPENVIQVTNDSYTVTVMTNGNEWDNSYEWYLFGVEEKFSTGQTFTIDWRLPVGPYELTVVAKQNGIPYSASAQFKVVNR